MGILRALGEVGISLTDTFGFGRRKLAAEEQRIVSGGCRAAGTVTEVKTCWWIKINTKAFRRHALDGASFPRIIYFSYRVNGVMYRGRSCVSWYLRCPDAHETVAVYYDRDQPEKCAVSLGASL